LFGVPVAFLGLAFFLAMVAARLPGSWRRTTPAVRRGRVALAVAGVGFVVYLIFAELFLLDAVCLWCTAVHVVAFGLFGVVALATALIEP
jgi:uncharacterized membrane protein